MKLYAVLQDRWEDRRFIGVFDDLNRVCELFNVPREKLKYDESDKTYWYTTEDDSDDPAFIDYKLFTARELEVNEVVGRAAKYDNE